MLERTQMALAAPWRRELKSFVRAFSGAFLFGIPLLYTMVMWWLGEFSTPVELFSILAIAFLTNFGTALAVGFRRETSLVGALEQTIDAIAVGAVGGTVVLLALNQIVPDDPPLSIVAKIVTQALPPGASSRAVLAFRSDPRAGQVSVDGVSHLVP